MTDERIYGELRKYREMGIIQYAGTTEPPGGHWTVGYDGKLVKFATREGIVGFLAGIQAFAVFLAKGGPDSTALTQRPCSGPVKAPDSTGTVQERK